MEANLPNREGGLSLDPFLICMVMENENRIFKYSSHDTVSPHFNLSVFYCVCEKQNFCLSI